MLGHGSTYTQEYMLIFLNVIGRNYSIIMYRIRNPTNPTEHGRDSRVPTRPPRQEILGGSNEHKREQRREGARSVHLQQATPPKDLLGRLARCKRATLEDGAREQELEQPDLTPPHQQALPLEDIFL
jgi:hypothetical protein